MQSIYYFAGYIERQWGNMSTNNIYISNIYKDIDKYYQRENYDMSNVKIFSVWLEIAQPLK